MPNLQVFTGLSVGSAEVETRLPFRHEVDPAVSLWGVGDDTRFDGGGTELALLRSAPSIGMGQHKLNAARYRVPSVFSVVVGGNKERFRRIEEVAHEI